MTISSLLQSIFFISMAINAPTIINAGAVISSVITDKIGEKNKATVKHNAILTDVNPVLPPAAIPAEDSTLVAGVDVPSTAPIQAAEESAKRARPILGISLFFIIPA